MLLQKYTTSMYTSLIIIIFFKQLYKVLKQVQFQMVNSHRGTWVINNRYASEWVLQSRFTGKQDQDRNILLEYNKTLLFFLLKFL